MLTRESNRGGDRPEDSLGGGRVGGRRGNG